MYRNIFVFVLGLVKHCLFVVVLHLLTVYDRILLLYIITTIKGDKT